MLKKSGLLFLQKIFVRKKRGVSRKNSIRKASPLTSAFLILSISLILPGEVYETYLDAGLQYRLYLKALSFDREWKARVGDEFVIGILFQFLSKDSRFVKDIMVEAIRNGPSEFNGVPIRFVEIPLKKISRLSEDLKKEKVDALYVAPIVAVGVGEIAAICRELHIATFTGIEKYVKSGISIGFGFKGKETYVLINLEASRAEGQDFSSRFLDMVTVIEEKAR